MHCLDGLVNLRLATRETMFNYFQLIDTKSLQEKISKGDFPFSKYLFWDAPIENIDIEKNKKYIIILINFIQIKWNQNQIKR